MKFDKEILYQLLPAIFRIRDTELGLKLEQEEDPGFSTENYDEIHGPLKALFEVISKEVEGIEENLDQLYDDQFIETCAEWVVPYIGELVGTRSLISINDPKFSQRSEVANTIQYRRRKGTAFVIEQLARDVTGWDANVVEFFQVLATTQYMNHLRPKNLSISGVKDWNQLEYANTPFDQMPKTVDVRRIVNNRGKYNIQNIGIFLWRIKNYSLTKSPAFKIDDGRYTFDAIGMDTQLYNVPIPEDSIEQLAIPLNVPMPISRRLLHERLEVFYGPNKSMLIYVDGDSILQDKICVCNLSDHVDGGVVTGWINMPEDDKVAIDPVLGRIYIPESLMSPPDEPKVTVTYQYGFTSEMGGGEYDRETTFDNIEEDSIKRVPTDFATIQAALDQMDIEGEGGVIEIEDNEKYIEDLTINIPADKKIEIRVKDGNRPVLILSDKINIAADVRTELIINGLLISGGRVFVDSDSSLSQLRLIHCTIVPSSEETDARIHIASPETRLEIEKSIVGNIEIIEGASAYIEDSIIDATEPELIAYEGLDSSEGGLLHIANSTVIGKVNAKILEMASNTIFTSEILVKQIQKGCIRFSYYPDDISIVPRPYQCQPIMSEEKDGIVPSFTSLIYGDPGYCQLDEHCVIEITQGADDESEMGAFHHLYQPQKVSNLRIRLDEYLRFGMEAGIFFAS